MLRTIVFAVLCLFFQACSTDTVEGAREFLTELYLSYEKNSIEINIKSNFGDSILAPELLRLVRLDENRPKGENGYLNWDPLCDCQDPEGIHLDTIVIFRKSGITFGEVRLNYLGATKVIYFKLALINGKIFISDIGSRSNPSLYDYLLENLSKDFPDSIRNIRSK